MLTITLRSEYKTEDYPWYVGQDIPKLSPIILGKCLVTVTAGGDELEYIKKNFKNVPFHKSKLVQFWIGDLAKFIALNLNEET